MEPRGLLWTVDTPRSTAASLTAAAGPVCEATALTISHDLERWQVGFNTPKLCSSSFQKSDILRSIPPGELSGWLLPGVSQEEGSNSFTGSDCGYMKSRQKGKILPRKETIHWEQTQRTEGNGKQRWSKRVETLKPSKLPLLTSEMGKPRHRERNRFSQGHILV